MKVHWLLQKYLAPTDGESPQGAPAGDSDSESDSSVDWAELNDGVSPGADDAEDEESEDLDHVEPDLGEPPETPDPKTPTNEVPQSKVTEPPVPEPAKKEKTPEEVAAEEEELSAKYKEWETAETQRLVGEYTFDEETAAQLLTEPEIVLPKLAAKLRLDTIKATLEAVQRMVPQMVPQVINKTGLEEKATNFFYEKNPDLRDHHAQVLIAGQMFRKLNPKATPEEAAEKIGNIVRSSLGLKTSAGKETKVTTPVSKPHRPAKAGGGSGTTPQPKDAEKTVWTELLDDD